MISHCPPISHCHRFWQGAKSLLRLCCHEGLDGKLLLKQQHNVAQWVRCEQGMHAYQLKHVISCTICPYMRDIYHIVIYCTCRLSVDQESTWKLRGRLGANPTNCCKWTHEVSPRRVPNQGVLVGQGSRIASLIVFCGLKLLDSCSCLPALICLTLESCPEGQTGPDTAQTMATPPLKSLFENWKVNLAKWVT